MRIQSEACPRIHLLVGVGQYRHDTDIPIQSETASNRCSVRDAVQVRSTSRSEIPVISKHRSCGRSRVFFQVSRESVDCVRQLVRSFDEEQFWPVDRNLRPIRAIRNDFDFQGFN